MQGIKKMEDKLAESQSYIKYLEAKLEEKEKSKKKTTSKKKVKSKKKITSKKKVKSKKKITSKKKSVTPKTNWWDPLPSKEKKKREPSSSSVDSFFDSVEEKGKKAKEKALHIESRIKNINIGGKIAKFRSDREKQGIERKAEKIKEAKRKREEKFDLLEQKKANLLASIVETKKKMTDENLLKEKEKKIKFLEDLDKKAKEKAKGNGWLTRGKKVLSKKFRK